MKKFGLLCLSTIALVGIGATLASCGSSSKEIRVCASELPHADVLENCVKDILKDKGYTLKVDVLDWTLQNDAVAEGDYDANYFQHVPYLNTYNGSKKLVATCKVHYEPLGIYSNSKTALSAGTYEVCDDVSNAVRAFQLLVAKGVISKTAEGTNFPYTEPTDGSEPTLTFSRKTWTSTDGLTKVTLVAENLLVASLNDYDFACLPCNTAITGQVPSSKQVAKEDDPDQVALKANILAVREDDYKNDSEYKEKIDVLTDALLSTEVASYFSTTYYGAITCDSSSQIDLRSSIK